MKEVKSLDLSPKLLRALRKMGSKSRTLQGFDSRGWFRVIAMYDVQEAIDRFEHNLKTKSHYSRYVKNWEEYIEELKGFL